jgi:hypothetical protein
MSISQDAAHPVRTIEYMFPMRISVREIAQTHSMPGSPYALPYTRASAVSTAAHIL